ncbi:MAG: hypothetical protein ACLUZ4_01765 [Christensenellaceae bacterium]|jgi:hypothetical protein
MKLFLVDIMGCLELPHHETFFFKDVREGRTALFKRSLTSLDELSLVRDWLTEEVNRNPFSIDNGVVVFFIPRDLTGRRIPMDYEIYVKLCVNELVSRHLDKRFRFVCFFLDKADRNARDDSEYRRIREVCETFSSNNPELRNVFLPASFVPKEADAAETEALICTLGDATAKQFYLRVLDSVRKADPIEGVLTHEDWYRTRFLGQCSETVSDISDFHVSYFSGDVSRKTELLLKTVEYVCSFVQEYNPEQDFALQFKDFLTDKNFSEFDPDMDMIKLRIAVLKRRLEEWTSPEAAEVEKADPLVFENEEHYKEFEREIENVSADELNRLMRQAMKRCSLREMCGHEFTSSTMDSLQKLLANADKRLKAFCGDRVRDFSIFFRQHDSAVINRENDELLTDNEREAEFELAKLMNQYSANELPGYSEELKIQQELDLIGKKIYKIGACLERMKLLPFLLTILFALTSVGLYYYGVQNSVFDRENTLYVFILYLAVIAIPFALVYFSVKAYYKKKVRKLFKKCMELVRDYLKSFAGKAEEFEKNINSAMNYYCITEQNNRASQRRRNDREYEERILWHRRKIAETLENLQYFDGFIAGVVPKEETASPKLDPFEDDAMHSEFYQMRIF